MDDGAPNQMQNTIPYRNILDSELVILCQKGDQEAFGELVRRHQNSALKVAMSIVRDTLDAEDEVQSAFWKAYRHINQFQHDAKFSTWLTRIVVNQCLMNLRRGRRAKLCSIDETQSPDDALTFELQDLRLSPEQQLGQTEVSRMLEHEISRTPPLLRKVFLLRDVEDRPMPEVAAQLGITVAAAKSRLLRARAELRDRLQRHLTEKGAATLTP